MNLLKLGLASVSALVAFTLIGSAEAGSRWKLRYFSFYPEYESYYPGPVFIPRPRYYQNYDRFSSYDEDSYDEEFDPEYYEPEYVPPKKKLKKTQKPAASKPTASKQQTQPRSKKPLAISCDKASKIVAGYGFSGVKASSCEGKEYAFAATRDGKKYVIKMSSANGELTQVKKQ